MRPIFRSAIAIIAVLSLLDMSAFAAASKPLGMVVQAREASIDNASLAVGTTVYPGDTIQTEDGGSLRLKFGATQLYLLSASAATFSQKGEIIRATVGHGTVGFSSNDSGNVELEIPQGILRAEKGQSAYGQVSIISPLEVVVSSYRGTLVLDNDGELFSIPAGKTYRVDMDLEPAGQPAAAAVRDQDQSKDADTIPTRRRRRRLKYALIFTGLVALGSWAIFDEISESPSKPK
ncbi:MAG TPA: hypothetical protein VGD60_09540 [Candidatus Acidoferrales bacterium]